MITRTDYKIILVYLILFVAIYLIFIGQPFWNGFIPYLVGIGTKVASAKIYDVAIFPLYPIFLIIEIVISFVPVIATRRSKSKIPKKEKIALIIPCHKASNVIRETIVKALKVFSKDEIYVVDNGNSPTPLDDTKDICCELGVNYFWCPVGSKDKAIYVGAQIAETKFIMQIDDDVWLNEDMSFPIKDDTHCIGYTISAKSHTDESTNLLQQLQDIEYKTCNNIFN